MGDSPPLTPWEPTELVREGGGGGGAAGCARAQLPISLARALSPQPRPSLFLSSSISLALIAGLAAGILGVEGWAGFGYYIVSQAAVRVGVGVRGQGRPFPLPSQTLIFFHSHVLSLLVQSAAIVYSKAGGVPAAFSPSPISLLVGEALGSGALLTFFLWWALAHNFCHLYS